MKTKIKRSHAGEEAKAVCMKKIAEGRLKHTVIARSFKRKTSSDLTELRDSHPTPSLPLL